MQRLNTIVSNSAAVTLAHGAGLFIRYLTILAIGRSLGTRGVGVYALTAAIALVASTIGRAGLDQAVTKLVAQGATIKGVPDPTSVVGTASLLSVLFVAPIVIGLIAASSVIADLFEEPILGQALRWMAPALPLLVLMQLWSGTLRGLHLTRQSALVEQLIVPLVAVASFAVKYIIGDVNVLDPVRALVFAYFVGAVIVHRLLVFEVQNASLFRFDRQLVSPMLHLGIPLGLDGIVASMTFSSTEILLGSIAGTTAVGLFAPALRVANLVTLPLTATSAVFAPVVSGLHVSGDTQRINDMYSRLSIATVISGAALAVVAVIAGAAFFQVMGSGFAGSLLPLLILLVSQVLNAATGPSSTLLAMTGHQWARLTNGLVALVAHVIGGLLLIPALGVVGAALSTGIGIAILQVLQVVEVMRWEGSRPYTQDAWRSWKGVIEATRDNGLAIAWRELLERDNQTARAEKEESELP